MKKISLIILLFVVSIFAYGHDHHDSEKGYEFVKNNGQFKGRVLYKSRLKGGAMFLEKDRFTFDMMSAEELVKGHTPGVLGGVLVESELKVAARNYPEATPSKKHAYSMIFENANSNVVLDNSNLVEGYKNFYHGNDRTK
jgi:hypothetical protein